MRYPVFVFSLILPVLALPFSILESIKKNKSFLSLVSVALAFATLAFSIDPPFEYDLYRHYERIDSLQGLSFSQVIEFTKSGFLLFDSYAWLINTIGLPKQFFTASIVFVSYLLVFLVFKDIKIKYIKELNEKNILLIFIAFWLSIGFIGLSSGLRNGFSNIIIFYIGYNFIFYNKYILFLIGSIFAFFIHPFAAATALLIFLAKVFNKFSILGKWLILIGLFFSLSQGMIFLIINFFDGYLSGFSFYKANYLQVDSEWGAGYIDTRNTNGIIGAFLITRLPIYIALIYLLVVKKEKDSVVYLLLCGMILYLLVFFQYHTIHSRMASLFVYFFTVYIVYKNIYIENRLNKFFFLSYSFSLCIYSIYSIYLLKNHGGYIASISKGFYTIMPNLFFKLY